METINMQWGGWEIRFEAIRRNVWAYEAQRGRRVLVGVITGDQIQIRAKMIKLLEGE